MTGVPTEGKEDEDEEDAGMAGRLRHRRSALEGDELPRVAEALKSPADVEEDEIVRYAEDFS